MAKALRVFIILVLLLSIAALVLGVLLFQQREQLKGRTQNLENAVVDVAGKLTAAKDPYIEAIPQTIDRNALMSLTTMTNQLDLLKTFAENRYDELYTRSDELKQTRDELADTRQQLAQTRQELADARAEIARLQGELKQKEAELAQANQQISELNDKVAGLETDVADLKKQIAALEEDKRTLEDDKKSLALALQKYEKDRGGLPTNMPAGLSGHILVVNPDWNFVVLDVGSAAGVQANAEMLVHRGDALIGKVRITDVKNNLAVADIQRGFGAASLEPGDTVFYPGL